MQRLTREILFDSDNLSQNLAQKSVRGGMTTMGSQGVGFVLGIASTAVLARLLAPADYGLIGMVMVVVGFAAMFKDAGLSMATVQKERITHEQISTLFWINLCLSVVLVLCVLTVAPLVSLFYGKPELTPVTAALSASFLISGLTIQHQALFQRHMRFGMLASIQIASQVITLIVTISLAVLGWRYWALVGGSLASVLVASLLTFLFCPWIPGRMQKSTGVRDMLKFGGHLTGFDFVNYFSRNADNILIGKFIGTDALGLYSRAYSLFMMPISQIRGPLVSVAFPVLSSLRTQPERYARYYRRLLETISFLTMPMAVYCAIEAEFLIRLLLGSAWLGVVPVFRILAIVGMVQASETTRGVVLMSCGLSKRYFYWGLFNAILCIISFIAGLPFGIEGVATAYAIASYAILIPSLFYCFNKTPVSVSLFLRTLAWPTVTSFSAGALVIVLKWVWPSESILSHGVAALLFCAVCVGFATQIQTIRDTLTIILRSVLRPPETRLGN